MMKDMKLPEEQMLTSDTALLEGCRRGEQNTWAEVVRKYERLVYSVPLRLGLSREEASDIFQTTFTYLLQSLDAIRDGERLGGWLATVARRQSWLFIQRSRRETPVLDELEDEHLSADAAVLSNSGIDRLDRWERTMWLDQGLADLGVRCRDLLTALYFDAEQPAYTEVAARFGMPVGSIGPTRARCLEHLKQLLEAN